MFSLIPKVIPDRMRALEERDFRDREDGTERRQRLRQVPPETGRFIALPAADNAINHREKLQPMLDRALSDNRVDGLIVPIGKGVLVCRKREDN